ncbi:MAG: hypothetical protein KDD43_13980 [Bdellovibrionales bacterium]|nr:hypothetical protein [Bdellovibrionales bacterium]
MSIDKEEIKRLVPIGRLLDHYGNSPNERGSFHCLFPENHHNGDRNPSGSIHSGRAYCHSQKCLGEKGSDIFSLVGLKENLSKFNDQKNWIISAFGLSNGPSPQAEILRVYKWTDAEGRIAYHLRTNDPDHKFKWNQKSDGTGAWTLKPCKPDLYQRDRVKEAQSVIVCAGERDCGTLNGWLTELKMYPETVATTPYSGEASVKAGMLTLVHGKEKVYVVGDNDQTGEAYREKVLGFLQGKVESLYPLRVPQEFNDVLEWAKSGATAQALRLLLTAASSVHA